MGLWPLYKDGVGGAGKRRRDGETDRQTRREENFRPRESRIRGGTYADASPSLHFPPYLHRSISPSLSPCMYQRLLKISHYRVIMTSFFLSFFLLSPRPQHQIPSASTTGRASVSVCSVLLGLTPPPITTDIASCTSHCMAKGEEETTGVDLVGCGDVRPLATVR